MTLPYKRSRPYVNPPMNERHFPSVQRLSLFKLPSARAQFHVVRGCGPVVVLLKHFNFAAPGAQLPRSAQASQAVLRYALGELSRWILTGILRMKRDAQVSTIVEPKQHVSTGLGGGKFGALNRLALCTLCTRPAAKQEQPHKPACSRQQVIESQWRVLASSSFPPNRASRHRASLLRPIWRD